MKKLEELSAVAHRIVDVAEHLIQQKGYNGFSYDDIAQQVGLKKPSIHHHFPTKANLVTMVVERYTFRFAQLLKEIEEKNVLAIKKLDAYIELFSNTFATNRRLCVCGMLGAESDVLPPEIQEAVAKFFELNRVWLTHVFAQGMKNKEFRMELNANEQALYLLSALEGAMIVGRGFASNTTLKEVALAAMRLIAN